MVHLACKACGENLEPKRGRISPLCFKCGELAAQKERRDKEKRVVQAYNKGPLVYGGSDANVKEIVGASSKAVHGHNVAGTGTATPGIERLRADSSRFTTAAERRKSGEAPILHFRYQLDHYEGPPGDRIAVFRRVAANRTSQQALDKGDISREHRVKVQR